MLVTAKPSRVRNLPPESRIVEVDEVIEARHSYHHGQHDLTLLVKGDGERHIADLRSGEAEFALVVEDPLILIGSRFGDAIPWSLAPYNWHFTPREAQILPPLAKSPGEERIALAVVLVDAADKTIRARRCVTLSLDFTRALNEAIREQAQLPFDPRAQTRAMADLHNRGLTARSVVARASCRTLGSS